MRIHREPQSFGMAFNSATTGGNSLRSFEILVGQFDFWITAGNKKDRTNKVNKVLIVISFIPVITVKENENKAWIVKKGTTFIRSPLNLKPLFQSISNYFHTFQFISIHFQIFQFISLYFNLLRLIHQPFPDLFPRRFFSVH